MNSKDARQAAIGYHGRLKPSFIALARAVGVTPARLAKAMYDDAGQARFSTELLIAMVKAKVEKELQAEEAAE